MRRVIAIANQKGGVGKTTTNINLSSALAQDGKKVLTLDADPQGNTTTGLGITLGSSDKTLYDLMMGECEIHEAVIKTKVPGLFLIPSNIELAGAEIELIGADKREYILKNLLDSARGVFDFVLIDCPPSLNLLTINALTAADTVLVPLQCEYYALEGLSKLLHTIDLVKKKLNPLLQIEGVVFTMFDSRTNLSMEVVDEVKRHLPKTVYKSIVPRNVRLSEAPSHGLPICLYDPKSKGAEAYELLAHEVIENQLRV